MLVCIYGMTIKLAPCLVCQYHQVNNISSYHYFHFTRTLFTFFVVCLIFGFFLEYCLPVDSSATCCISFNILTNSKQSQKINIILRPHLLWKCIEEMNEHSLWQDDECKANKSNTCCILWQNCLRDFCPSFFQILNYCTLSWSFVHPGLVGS